MQSPALLEVRGLRTLFRGEQGEILAVDGVDLRVERGRTLGIVGESGCGKSVTALSIMGLVPQPPGRIAAGEVLFEGEDLLKAPLQRLRDLRGDKLAMIFQEPMTSLNPAFQVGDQIAETLLRHRDVSREEADSQSVEMLRRVRIPSPERRAKDYPHQLSGGMRQRVMIAMALACNPRLLIADEPTTALDVTIQAQILELMRALREELGTAIILITHDLGVIAELADEVAVMYAGKVIERCAVEKLFAEPQHPYTIGLLGSIPRLHMERERLAAIQGFVPDAAALPEGCRFHPRCPFAIDRCSREIPPLEEITAGHFVACWRALHRLLRAENLAAFPGRAGGRRREPELAEGEVRSRRGRIAGGSQRSDGCCRLIELTAGKIWFGNKESRPRNVNFVPCGARCRSSPGPLRPAQPAYTVGWPPKSLCICMGCTERAAIPSC
jgi:oligopeptide/dipeptide ABC transporter ATP-binding protein